MGEVMDSSCYKAFELYGCLIEYRTQHPCECSLILVTTAMLDHKLAHEMILFSVTVTDNLVAKTTQKQGH